MTEKYCIIKVETHPDRIVEDIYGPYDDYSSARNAADTLEKASQNYNGIHRLYDFNIREMITLDSWLSE